MKTKTLFNLTALILATICIGIFTTAILVYGYYDELMGGIILAITTAITSICKVVL